MSRTWGHGRRKLGGGSNGSPFIYVERFEGEEGRKDDSVGAGSAKGAAAWVLWKDGLDPLGGKHGA